jgi:hypothetical protein
MSRDGAESIGKAGERNRCRSALALSLAMMIVLAVHSHAKSHGSAEWIMNHPDFGWCCGPKDCFWLEPEEVRVDGDQFVVDRFSIRWPVIGSYPSADRHYWACYFMRGTEHQEIKCFFAPRPVTENGPIRSLSIALAAPDPANAGRTSSSARPS